MLSCIVVARTQLHIEGLQMKSCIAGLQISRIPFLCFQVNNYMESLDLQIRSEACKCIEMKACIVNYCIQGFQLNACQCILKGGKVIFILQSCQNIPAGAGMSMIEFLNILCGLGSE
jgi:hypothetical protein